ncbi:MAG TPA: RNA polymerase subunit sigma, partial [Alcanivorax sp.]|nr:RNA polymerase subunit sigma [Alcanivorax sp.]
MYAAHHGWLTHWLHGRLRCPQDAADLSQDTFLRLILGEQSLEALRDPRAYLMVIASRLMINRHHRRQVEEEALRQVAILVETRDQRGPAEIAAA